MHLLLDSGIAHHCHFCGHADFPLVESNILYKPKEGVRICWHCAEIAVTLVDEHNQAQERLVAEYGPRP